MTPAAFLSRLKHLVLGHPVLQHPLWTDLELGYYDREALRIFSIHYYHHVLRTRLYDAAALAACPDERIQAALASILWDEYGAGDPARTHPEQFRRVLRALHINILAADRAPRLPELEEYSRIHFDLCRPASFWQAMGAVGFAMEWPIPYLYEPVVRGYRRIAGLGDHDLEFFLEHIPSDETHGALMVECLAPYLGLERIQGALIEGAMASMDARERLVEAISRKMAPAAVPR
ncbi:MAG TPA: iron-containing redox enzyme family protein [Planctomycetota bacterium]|nr:iron-containing redox enzyme family protein [Planctomycetota bacterium]